MGVSNIPPSGQSIEADLRQVTLPSGADYKVHKSEVRYFEERVQKYVNEYVFTSISDLQDLDKIVCDETLCHRWMIWLSRGGFDYWDEQVDTDKLQKAYKDHSVEIRQVKDQLGVDKKSRDRLKGDDNQATFMRKVLERAREFGIIRNKQVDKALGLWKDLASMVRIHDQADERERIELRITPEDIMDWVRTYGIPEFETVDREWREGSQKLWIQSM